MDWPIVGILPSIIANLHNFHDYLTDVLLASGCNFKAHGPMASGVRFFFTSDPANVQHIFTSNHTNYPKGEAFAEIFDIMSGSIITVDGEAWRRQRGRIKSILSDPRLLAVTTSCCHEKVAKGLIPFLTRMASTGVIFDMQDLIMRVVLDMSAMLVFGVDPGCLSPSMPPMHVADAMDMVMEVGLFRHIAPASCWKMMRWLNIGPERKLAAAHKVLHEFIKEMMEIRKAMRIGLDEDHNKVDAMYFLSSDPEYSDDLLLRRTLINYMVAGRDTVGTTLPWVFYNLIKNPCVVDGIRKELAPIANQKGTDTMVVFDPVETKSLVYLQAVLYESLRLYPPTPIERTTVLVDDVLPSGHRVHSNDTILISIYAMGRTENIWGKDCHLYRPERWLSEDGTRLRYVPSHKFMAFNSGPRMCLGKDIAIMQMKTIVAAVVWNFDMEELEGQSIEPKMSCILQIKNGFMVTVKKREECNDPYDSSNPEQITLHAMQL